MAKDSKIEVTSTQPNFALKNKLGPDVDIREAFPEEVIAEAESMIEESKDDFFTDALDELHVMEDAYAYAIKNPKNSGKHIKEIELKVFSMKGQSETLGFDLLAMASKSLYEFCIKYFREGDEEQLVVVRKHLDTIKLVIKDQMKGDGGQVGKELIQSLHLLTKKYE